MLHRARASLLQAAASQGRRLHRLNYDTNPSCWQQLTLAAMSLSAKISL